MFKWRTKLFPKSLPCIHCFADLQPHRPIHDMAVCSIGIPVLYPGHVSSLAGDLRGPVKNRKPRASDSQNCGRVIFWRESLFIGTCRAETWLSRCHGWKRKRGAFVWRPFNRSLAVRVRRCLAKINFGVDRFATVNDNGAIMSFPFRECPDKIEPLCRFIYRRFYSSC